MQKHNVCLRNRGACGYTLLAEESIGSVYFLLNILLKKAYKMNRGCKNGNFQLKNFNIPQPLNNNTIVGV